MKLNRRDFLKLTAAGAATLAAPRLAASRSAPGSLRDLSGDGHYLVSDNPPSWIPGEGWYFDGEAWAVAPIDMMVIYDRALTSEEIQAVTAAMSES